MIAGEASGSESEGTSAAEEDGHATANNHQNDLIPQLAVPNDVLQYGGVHSHIASSADVSSSVSPLLPLTPIQRHHLNIIRSAVLET